MNPITETGKTLKQLATDIVTSEETTETEHTPNGELLATHGLKVMHIRPNAHTGHRGMTIAYRQQHRKASVVEIATALVHPSDTFTKKIGTRLAVESFVAGQTVLLPVARRFRKTDVTHMLSYYFD
jgi:hypothetical protein